MKAFLAALSRFLFAEVAVNDCEIPDCLAPDGHEHCRVCDQPWLGVHTCSRAMIGNCMQCRGTRPLNRYGNCGECGSSAIAFRRFPEKAASTPAAPSAEEPRTVSQAAERTAPVAASGAVPLIRLTRMTGVERRH